MKSGIPIEISGLSKQFGHVTAVDDLSFTVEPGRVTGFLGPNGAGKTTTLRVLLGLVRATAGTATFGGTPYRDLPKPLETVGAALDANFHPGRTARNHLKVYATAAGLPSARVPAVLEQVGIAEFADRRVGGYSLGMRQRLSLAYTLLGDPGVLVLDEPINGLDPEGIKWIRGFLQRLAHEGRTVLVSSHLLSEVQQSVDDVVIISRGRLVRSGTAVEPRARRGTAHDRRLPRSPPARRRTRPGGAGVHRGPQRLHRRRARPRPRRPRGIRRRGGAQRPAPTAIRARGVVPLPRERRGESARGRRGEPRRRRRG